MPQTAARYFAQPDTDGLWWVCDRTTRATVGLFHYAGGSARRAAWRQNLRAIWNRGFKRP